jgi:hypothetical protein
MEGEMKFKSLKKVFILFASGILCFLINASLSEAEQPVNDLTSQIFSAEALGTLNDYDEEKVVKPVIKPVAASKYTGSSFDVKLPLSEQFKAFLSLGDQNIKDLDGRDLGQTYNAVVGFQIILQ